MLMRKKTRKDSRRDIGADGRFKLHRPKFCVVGAGHGGLAMAGHLALMGFEVNLWNRSKARIEAIIHRGRIQVDGVIKDTAEISLATTNMREAVSDVDVIMVVIPANGHREVAEKMAPHLHDGQIIVLNPGRTFGAIEVSGIFRSKNVRADVTVAEAQTFLYVARHIEPASAKIFQIKNTVQLAAIPSYRTPKVLNALKDAFPQFVTGTNVLATSFDNVGSIFHPGVTILNASRIESTHGDFQYYLEGITPAVGKVLERMDDERRKVASALGVASHSVREWLYLVYDSPGKTLHEAVHATGAYVGVKAPPSMLNRYITEDVPMSLVPISSIAKQYDVPTPTIDSMIHLASAMHDTDFWKIGRSVESLGLSGMTKKELRHLALHGWASLDEKREGSG